MDEIPQSNQSGSTLSTPGKYLTFLLSAEKYGIPIQRVQEIIGVSHITQVPRSGKYMKGVFNLRGKIIAVVDLRLKFNLPVAQYDSKTCVIVVEVVIDNTPTALGVIVDTVLEVLSFSLKDIEPAPQYGSSLKTSYIVGMGRMTDGDVSILLDIDSALGSEIECSTK